MIFSSPTKRQTRNTTLVRMQHHPQIERHVVKIVSVTLFIVFVMMCYVLHSELKDRGQASVSVLNVPPGVVSHYCERNFVNVIEDNRTKNSENITCDLLASGNLAEICRARHIHVHTEEHQILEEIESCQFLPHLKAGVTHEEKFFPLAFSILVHKDIWHLVGLLKLIYSPNNFYCIHVDAKSLKLLGQVQKLVKCFPDNVFLCSKLEIVYWGGMEVLRATLNCLKDLCKRNRVWKYFLNLSAQDFPLKTNYELVEALRGWNGANNVEVKEESRPSRYLFHHDILYSKNGDKYPDRNIRTEILKSPPPSNITSIFKGNLAVALSRAASEWIVWDGIPHSLSVWLQDTDIPDEHFFATLFGNAHSIAPGKEDILKRITPYLARYSLWKPSPECGGKFVHDVCIFGVADVMNLIRNPDQLFLNKIHGGFQSFAYQCLTEWFLRKR